MSGGSGLTVNVAVVLSALADGFAFCLVELVGETLFLAKRGVVSVVTVALGDGFALVDWGAAFPSV